MELVNKLRLALEGLDRKDFYKHLIIVFVLMAALMGFMVYWHVSSMSDLRVRIDSVNETREKTVRSLLKRMAQVQQQRGRVKDILAKEPNFKIAGYFNEVLMQQGLIDFRTEENVSEVDMGNDNTEISLRARFSAITMKQLCELLDVIEKKERIYAKNLEITKSVKMPESIDVNLTVATLQPKTKR